MDPRLIEELAAAKAAQLDEARSGVVATVHQAGRLTARERVGELLDPGTEVEYGSIAAIDRAAPEGTRGWIAEAGGVDYIGTVDGQTVITSSTDFTDRGGGYGAGRLERLFALAQEHRWPLVLFVDGGGSRARHPRVGLGHLELNGPFGRYQLFDGVAELSGWVPTVAVVSGPSFAGHASLAGFSDFVIATGGSSIGMGGPPMVEAALGLALSASELAGVEMHEQTGGIDLLVDDEHQAIAAARRYLSYWRDEPSGPAAAGAGRIADLVTDRAGADGPYDMVPVLEALVDEGSLFGLRPQFARSVITAFARIDGRSVGILASQPGVDDGAIDEQAATKAARFVELCDAYELPIVAIIDTPGCVTRFTGDDGTPQRQPGLNRWHTRAVMAHHHRTVPLFAVQVGRGGGMGPAVLGGMTGGRSTPVLWAAWPSTDIGTADGFAAVRNQHAYDDVIAPAETRHRIARLLARLPRQLDRPAKKHPIDTW